MKRKEAINTFSERKEEVKKYRVVQARFMFTALAIHPLMKPFAGPCRTMSRILNLNIYLLQVNAIQIGALYLF
jgi:hypothetical protein